MYLQDDLSKSFPRNGSGWQYAFLLSLIVAVKPNTGAVIELFHHPVSFS